MANWAKHKVRIFFEPRRSKRIKVQNDIPFGYAIEIQANTPPIQHHHQGAKKYHCCQKDVVGN